jgi:hypothetical protein
MNRFFMYEGSPLLFACRELSSPVAGEEWANGEDELI